MRRRDKSMPDHEARTLLTRVHHVHLASSLADGTPVLRVLHPVDLDGDLAFHAAPEGEKTGLIGRPAVASAVEWLGTVPSWAFHPRRACPATTWYRSAQVHGVLELVEDHDDKVRVLAGLMTRYQPEGGHTPLDDPSYRGMVDHLHIVRLRTERVCGKLALGQGKPDDVRARALDALWSRGGPDAQLAWRAMSQLPDAPLPARFHGPGVRFRPAPTDADLPGVLALLRDQYWNLDTTDADIAAAHLGSDAWIVADVGDRVVATARALSDSGKFAWVFDVAVAEEVRGTGVGTELLRLLLEHPAVRDARRVRLGTRDAMDFYRRFGFEERVGDSVTMELVRPS
jgi:N-acetylglutamate synthase-like GNAT family acetyltransferase/nitroimidazol reductase NimA-like FMN-containing flavoprotein (pyridoxamine 5'-phosphate oxidase superfamily)